jgi:hypothetical protein
VDRQPLRQPHRVPLSMTKSTYRKLPKLQLDQAKLSRPRLSTPEFRKAKTQGQTTQLVTEALIIEDYETDAATNRCCTYESNRWRRGEHERRRSLCTRGTSYYAIRLKGRVCTVNEHELTSTDLCRHQSSSCIVL